MSEMDKTRIRGDLYKSCEVIDSNSNLTANSKTQWEPKQHLYSKILSTIHDKYVPASTLMGQKYFHTKIFLYIFHIKLLIFNTFSWR
jgi:hypothetical protein